MTIFLKIQDEKSRSKNRVNLIWLGDTCAYELQLFQLNFHQNFPNFSLLQTHINCHFFDTLISLLRLVKVAPEYGYFFFIAHVKQGQCMHSFAYIVCRTYNGEMTPTVHLCCLSFLKLHSSQSKGEGEKKIIF